MDFVSNGIDYINKVITSNIDTNKSNTSKKVEWYMGDSEVPISFK